MNYVKSFKINGVDTKQVACIELQGAPNTATEGAVGVLGMDMTSLTHDVYRCVAVNGSIYTWELLSAGLSIIPAKITGEGGEQKSFPYSSLLIPERYIIKSGDLIIDSEGYLYQIKTIGAESCDAEYVGTHIGSAGAKTYKLVVTDGKLQLVTESGAVLSSVDYTISDELTLYRNSSTGVIQVRGVNTVNEIPLRFFVGTKAEYDALLNKSDLFAIITDDNTKADLEDSIQELYSFTEGNMASINEMRTDIDEMRTEVNCGTVAAGGDPELGATILELNRGNTYIIAHCEDRAHGGSERECAMLYVPKEEEPTVVTSSKTVTGHYFKVFYLPEQYGGWVLRCYDSSDTQIKTYCVTIRII